MNGSSNWKNDLCKGEKGENRVVIYLNKHFKEVVDTRYDKQYQADDVDFILTSKQDHEFTFELKTDYKISKTGNVLFATYNDRQTGRYEDWALKTKAKFIGIFDIYNDKLYIINWEKFKPHLNGFKEINWYNYSDKCWSYGRLASLQTLIDKGYVIQTIDIAQYCA